MIMIFMIVGVAIFSTSRCLSQATSPDSTQITLPRTNNIPELYPDMEQNGVLEQDIANNENILDFHTLGEPKSLALTHQPGFIWPTNGQLRSGFGYRKRPMGGSSRFHRGIDISAPKGTVIYAAQSGQIVHAARYGLMGKCVIIKHDKDFVTYYAHCTQILVKPGQWVTKGQSIALVGSTGLSTGPHVHFEIRQNGVPLDPLKFVHQN